MGTVAMEVEYHLLGSSNRPADSPGKLSDVFLPNPNARMYESSLVLPSLPPIMMVPTLDELATMSVIDHCWVGWFTCSPNDVPATVIVLDTVSRSAVLTTPSCTAADTV